MGCDFYIVPVVTIYYKNGTKYEIYLEEEKRRGYNYSDLSTDDYIEELEKEPPKIIYENDEWKIKEYQIPHCVKHITPEHNVMKIETHNYYYKRT